MIIKHDIEFITQFVNISNGEDIDEERENEDKDSTKQEVFHGGDSIAYEKGRSVPSDLFAEITLPNSIIGVV
jgi:hypothetical protein